MNFEKRNNIYKIIMIILVTAIVTFMITSILLYNLCFKTENGLTKALTTAKVEDLDTRIELIKRYLDECYLGEINEDNMMESAIKGYVAGLGDEYTEYLTKDEYEELMVDVNGSYIGIGVYMTQDKYGNLLVLLPIEGSPAEEAGIKTGDIITKVNGEDVTNMDLNLVVNKIKGEEKSNVEIEIKRDEEIINKTIERRIIEINNIKTNILENNIGYIQILSFDDGCAEEFELKLKELMDKNIKSLIIDVRDNGGGIVTEATDIADLFLPKDKTIMIELDKEGKEEYTKSKEDKIINSDINVILLANENSASASEILIGALKDNEVAKVIGVKTFGKGVMQEIVPVTTGGALKLTIKEFRTPNGDKINKEGISPDEEVTDIEDNDTDEQLQKAIDVCK